MDIQSASQSSVGTSTTPRSFSSSATNPAPIKFQWWWAAVGLLVIFFFSIFSGYNGLVTTREAVRKERGNLQTQYQRRADLVPNLVTIVKGAATNEEKILTEVIQARAKATSINIGGNDVTPEKMKEFQAAQGQLSAGLGRLLAVSEAYPQIGSTQGFRDLQVQLEGTENRIATARRDFNDKVGAYNTKRMSFPSNITASVFGFGSEPYFEADAGSAAAPKVIF
jgi:LemA protein